MKNKGLRSFLRALLCLILGLLLGTLVMTAAAWLDRPGGSIVQAVQASLDNVLMPLLTGGRREGIPALLGQAAPTILLALGVSLAWQAGMLQLGGAGQYALGAVAAMLCAAQLKLSWYACLTAAALTGALWGALPGMLKGRIGLREALGTALSVWLALYALQALSFQIIWVWSPRPDLSLTAALIAGALALLIWLSLRFTVTGLEIRLLGASEKTARYAGADTGKTAFLVLCLSGLLGGAAGGMDYLLGSVTQLPDLSLALTGPGLHALAAAALAGGNPLGAVCAAVVVKYLSLGMKTVNGALFTQETGEMILSIILYLCAGLSLHWRKGGRKT